LAFGDSITAGYRLDRKLAFPSLIEAELLKQNISAQVINAGISGDTALQGLQRIDWVLRHEKNIDLVLLELGANDGLRGLPIAEMEKSLRQIIHRFRAAEISNIILFGMKTTKNQSAQYQADFASSFPKIAKSEKVHYLPFFLEKIAFNPEFTLEDLIHPNEKGHQALANEILRFLKTKNLLPSNSKLNN